MSQTRRKFTREFKVAAVKRLQLGYPGGRGARELAVNPSQSATLEAGVSGTAQLDFFRRVPEARKGSPGC
jgi:transposase-like protein